MKIYALAAAAALAVCLSGCASIIKGSSDSIAITTPPTTGANCTLTNPRGSWSVVSPGAVTVQRSKGDVDIVCKKEGWADATGRIPSDFQGWTLGNILIGGIIGVGVDASTGAMNDYPNAFAVPMQQLPATAAPAAEPAAATPPANS